MPSWVAIRGEVEPTNNQAGKIMTTHLSNHDHQEQLASLIQRRLGGRIRDLRVIVDSEGVRLQGRAATYHVKQLAQHAAMELASQPVVANDIEVG
ncbi:MAG: hypothetical protein ACK4RK_03425 [Gemmataceae bacterium]